MLKKYNVAPSSATLKSTIDEISKKYALSPVVSTILVNRGYNIDSIPSFVDCNDDSQLESPFVLKDMQKAVDRINAAMNNGEKIAIYGDYDCDGVTSTALLYSYLLSIGCDVCYYIPDRFGEGYGINDTSLTELAKDGVNLIITVDNGISAINESITIKELGMDLIITDHHKPSDTLPIALAIINPHRSDCPSTFKALAGVGVAFKLITALEGGDYAMTLEYFSDIVALGTVGDVVPLTCENRIFVKRGLALINNKTNVGLNALLTASNVTGTVDAKTLAFTLSPRINASGRMGHATLSLNLLLEEEPEQALVYANEICALNTSRQATEKYVLADIDNMLEQNHKLLFNRALTFNSDNWHHGVIGIVCSRLVERYGKPVFLMCEDENLLVGSARCFKGISIHEILHSCKDNLIRYGGHAAAGGFSLNKENLPDFMQGIENFLAQNNDIMPYPEINIDMVIDKTLLDISYFEQLNLLEPFGQENNTPIFLLKNASLYSITKLSNDTHLKLNVFLGNKRIEVLLFGVSSDQFIYKENDTIDIVCNIEINEYNGSKSLVAKAKDIRKSDINEDKIIAGKLYYEKLKRKEHIGKAMLIKSAPSKNECVAVYKYLSSFMTTSIHLDDIYLPLCKTTINYCKYRIILDIFCELGLLSVNASQLGFSIIKSDKKNPLENSKIYTYFENILKN